MLYIIDDADIEKIRQCVEFYPVDGVTTNPTIISKQNTDFPTLIRSIRDVIGNDRMLHIQTTSEKAEDIIKEAMALQEYVGGEFYIKIPISPEGLKATMYLSKNGINVTATAIFTQQQALIAAKAGAAFVAPYVNRLDNIVSDGVHVVEEVVELFKQHNISAKVLAASFKTVEQIHKIAMTGCQSITINPELYEKLIYHPLTLYAVDDFVKDWETVYGRKSIMELMENH